MGYLYLISSSEGKNYVGVTTTLQRRITAHLSGKGSRLIKEALLKNIKFTHKILLEDSIEEVYKQEPIYIQKLNCLDPFGYNLGKGGYAGGVSDRSGSKNTQAILNEELVLEIRELYAKGNITQQILASRYGVTRETVSALVRGKSWPDTGGPITIKRNEDRKLDQYSIDLIRFLRYEDGLTYDQISKETGIAKATVAKYGSSRV